MKLLPVVLALLLSACSNTFEIPPISLPTQQVAWRAHQENINALAEWTLSGRLGVTVKKMTTNKQNETQSWTASLHWQQYHDHYQIKLAGPLGVGTHYIQGNSHNTYIQHGGDTKVLNKQTIQTLLGVDGETTLNALKYWIKGVTDPKLPRTQLRLQPNGLLSELEQNDTNIRISNYYLVNEDIYLPAKLLIQNDTLKLRIVVREWEI